MKSRPAVSRVLVGTLLLPAVFGALVLWSLADRAEETADVPAAVVNLDEPVTRGQGKEEQIIAAGRLLAGGLTSPADGEQDGLGWELTDAEDAEDGLRDGSYYAVITIPEDFSKTLASVTGKNPRSARISVRSNDASSPLVDEASRQVAQVAAARLGHRITATYLQGLFEQSGQLKLELGKASDAAGQVASGADQLQDGAGRLGSGADELAGGLGLLANGVGELDGGADRLASGAARIARGADRLAGGAGELDTGAGRLADGLETLDRRTDPLPRQTDRLADGAGQVADGTTAYADLLIAWKQACSGDPIVAGAQPRLCAVTLRAVGVQEENAEQLKEGARRVADGSRQLANATPQVTDAVGRASSGADRLAGGTGRLAAGADELATGTQRLADGASRLSSGAGELAGGAQEAGDGAERLAGGSAALADGSSRLSSGSERLATGLSDGAGQIPASDKDAAEVVADPVGTDASRLNPTADGASSLAPAVLAFGLWLGAFVTYLVRRALPPGGLRAPRSGWRIAVAGWLPALVTGVGQAVLLVLVALALGARFASPVLLTLLLLLSVAAFAAVNQAFVAALGRRRGWIVAIAFTALQAVTLGGLVPIETAPGPVQGLNAVLPVARALDGFAHLGLGGDVGSPLLDAVVVLLWGLAGLGVSTLAARRRQQVSLDDVRRSVAAVR